MDLRIPQPLKAEHDELHEELKRVTAAGGHTGEAARQVAQLLHPRVAIGMTERLRAELPEMLAEHRRIVGALDGLAEVAEREGHSDVARFAEALKQHALTEEEVLYPAAILLGDLLRLGAPVTPARPRP